MRSFRDTAIGIAFMVWLLAYCILHRCSPWPWE
jgi:hypothetical protein